MLKYKAFIKIITLIAIFDVGRVFLLYMKELFISTIYYSLNKNKTTCDL